MKEKNPASDGHGNAGPRGGEGKPEEVIPTPDLPKDRPGDPSIPPPVKTPETKEGEEELREQGDTTGQGIDEKKPEE